MGRKTVAFLCVALVIIVIMVVLISFNQFNPLFLILLLCPLMHVFMMKCHKHKH